MKKFKTLLLAILFMLNLVACNDTTDTSIVGEWEVNYENSELLLTFNTDNTYRITEKSENQEIENGTYVLGKAGMFTMESTDKTRILDGNYQKDKILLGDRNNPEASFEFNREK